MIVIVRNVVNVVDVVHVAVVDVVDFAVVAVADMVDCCYFGIVVVLTKTCLGGFVVGGFMI